MYGCLNGFSSITDRLCRLDLITYLLRLRPPFSVFTSYPIPPAFQVFYSAVKKKTLVTWQYSGSDAVLNLDAAFVLPLYLQARQPACLLYHFYRGAPYYYRVCVYGSATWCGVHTSTDTTVQSRHVHGSHFQVSCSFVQEGHCIALGTHTHTLTPDRLDY